MYASSSKTDEDNLQDTASQSKIARDKEAFLDRLKTFTISFTDILNFFKNKVISTKIIFVPMMRGWANVPPIL